MVLLFSGAGGDVTNPTVACPEDRLRATVVRLTDTDAAPGPGGACNPISCLTLEQALGFELSNDPKLQSRAATYGVSLSRRLQ